MRFGCTIGTIVVTLNILMTLATILTSGAMRFMALLAIILTVKALDRFPCGVLPATITLGVVPGTILTEPLIVNTCGIVNMHPCATMLTIDIIARFRPTLQADRITVTLLNVVVVVITATIVTTGEVIVPASIANVFLTTVTKHFILTIVVVHLIATTAMKVILGTTLTDHTHGFNVNPLAIHFLATIGTFLTPRRLHVNRMDPRNIFFRPD
jgi:hypothetical protein